MRQILALLALAAIAGPAHAAKPENVSDGELALTPPYCVDTMGFKYGDAYFNTSPRAGYWVGLMGKNFWTMHHYCWGLINLRRAQTAGLPGTMRRGLMESVIGDFSYVVQNSSPDFIMLPEVLTRTGEVNLLMGNDIGAYSAFEQARKIKPDYWPAYLRWAEVLIQRNQKAAAKDLLAEGLKHSPAVQPLREKYRLLGGLPPAMPPAASASAPAPVPAPLPASAPTPDSPPPPQAAASTGASAPAAVPSN